MFPKYANNLVNHVTYNHDSENLHKCVMTIDWVISRMKQFFIIYKKTSTELKGEKM